MNRINKKKVNTKLTEKQVSKIAEETAKALGSKFSVTEGSIDNRSFDLDYNGVKYDGGSYLIMHNGDVVNIALNDAPVTYNYKTRKKYEFGGDFQAGVYAKGGSLEAHGIKEGDTFLKTISGSIQKVKDKNGNIFYINLATGERDKQPPLPFDNGGEVKYFINKDGIKVRSVAKPEKKLTEAEWMAKHNESKEARGYESGGLFGFGGMFSKAKESIAQKKYPKLEGKQVMLKSGKYVQVFEQDGSKLQIVELGKIGSGERPQTIDISEVDTTSFDGGGAVKGKDTWQNIFEEYGFKKGRSKYGLEIYYKRGYTASVDKNLRNVEFMFEDNVLYKGYSIQGLLNALENEFGKRKFATGGGVGLIGNQKRIDMNKNGKIDAEDFKLLRSSMNGALRNERKHVNHNEDYEVRYARKKPARTGYKGKRNFATGGQVENYRTLSFKTKSTAEKNQKEIINYYGNRVLNTTIKRGIDERGDNGYYVEFNLKKDKLADGGGISKFKMLSDKVAKNYVGKRVKPQYQKEYGKVYSKSEAKEVGNKVAGKVKAMQKAESGTQVKKGGQGAIMILAKKIRKDGEKWTDAVKRAGQQLK